MTIAVSQAVAKDHDLLKRILIGRYEALQKNNKSGRQILERLQNQLHRLINSKSSIPPDQKALAAAYLLLNAVHDLRKKESRLTRFFKELFGVQSKTEKTIQDQLKNLQVHFEASTDRQALQLAYDNVSNRMLRPTTSHQVIRSSIKFEKNVALERLEKITLFLLEKNDLSTEEISSLNKLIQFVDALRRGDDQYSLEMTPALVTIENIQSLLKLPIKSPDNLIAEDDAFDHLFSQDNTRQDEEMRLLINGLKKDERLLQRLFNQHTMDSTKKFSLLKDIMTLDDKDLNICIDDLIFYADARYTCFNHLSLHPGVEQSHRVNLHHFLATQSYSEKMAFLKRFNDALSSNDHNIIGACLCTMNSRINKDVLKSDEAFFLNFDKELVQTTPVVAENQDSSLSNRY